MGIGLWPSLKMTQYEAKFLGAWIGDRMVMEKG
jgi:hypothetical protein